MPGRPRHLRPADRRAGRSGGRTLVGTILEHGGAIALVEDGHGGLDLPKSPALGGITEAVGLVGYLRRLGLHAELGFLLSVFEDPERGAGAILTAGTRIRR